MTDQIIQELNQLEKDHHIKILYAIESGSRAWGFASTNSDWDVRFIYAHAPEWYLTIDDRKDSMETILPNDIDLGGWDIRKALQLFHKSNPVLMEWLKSPLVYREEGMLAAELRKLSANFFNPKNCLHHYLHMAENNFKNYLQGELVKSKKYFYVLRPILACQWIETHHTMPPILFDTLFETFITDAALQQEVKQLLAKKKSGEELDSGPRNELLNEYLSQQIHHFQQLVKQFGTAPKVSNEPLHFLFRNTLATAWYNHFA